MADARGGAGREAPAQRPAADLPVRRRTTAEMVPASVLRHANAFMRLFEDSPEFMARAIARAAQLYLDRLPPPMFKALMDYTLHGQLFLAHARPRRRRRVPQEPGRPAVLPVLRREHAALRHLRLGRAARLAARPHRADRRGRAQRGAHLRRRRDAVRRRRHLDGEQDRLARHGRAAATSCCATATATSRSCTR